MNQKSQLIGIVWMVLHCLLISVMAAVIRHLSERLHVFEIIFFYNFVAFLLMLPVVFSHKRYYHLKTSNFHLHFARAFLGIISLTMYFYVLTIIPLTAARAVALTGPLVSSLFAVLFLKETLGWRRTLAMLIGFIGALVIVQPGTANFSIYSLLVLLAVSIWAVIDMIIKILSKTESTSSQLFYLTGMMSIMAFPGAYYYWVTPQGLMEWALLFAIGAIFLVNILAVFNAFKLADITVVMPFDFTGMIFTAIIAYLAFDEVINLTTAIGSVLIVVSTVYIAHRETKKAKEVHAVTPTSES